MWGGSFTLGEAVAARVALEARNGERAGLVFAAPGGGRAVELLAHRGRWVVRETAGDAVVQQLPIAAPASAELVIELAPAGRSVRITGHGAAQRLELTRPLAPGTDAAGIHVLLDPGAELEIRELSLTQPLPTTTGPGATLREAAASSGISLGTATDVWPPLHDLGFEALLAEHFDAVAPTELYWSTTRGEDEDYFFVPADLMINYATVHRQRVSGYFLVWDFELPAWLEAKARSGGAAELGAALDQHVTTLVGRYRGRMDAWVVVNEAVWGPEETGGEVGFAESVWLEALGPGYIERAFRAARAADPGAVLLYNETGAEALGPKSDFVYEVMSDFVARGVPIDGVGLQMHIDAAVPPDFGDIEANMARLGALGLEVHITELDVSVANLAIGEAAKQQRQAAIYADVVASCRAVPACRDVTVFGFGDAYAWDELGDASPLLFDEQYRPKPAFAAFREALRSAR